MTAIGVTPLKAPLTADFSPGAAFTLEGWFYLTNYAPRSWLMGKEQAVGGDPFLSFGLILDGVEGSRLMFASSTGAVGSYRSITAPTPLPLNTWVHCAAVFEGTATRLFVDGQMVASGTAAGAPAALNTVAFGLGSAFFEDGTRSYAPFPGYARQVRFWNVARTAAQIAASLSEELPTDRIGLVADWPLDETDTATPRDLSGAGRALSAGGMARTFNTALIASRPFFTDLITSVTDGSLSKAFYGQLIDFDSDGASDLIVGQLHFPPTSSGTYVRLRAFRNVNGTFVDVTDSVLGDVSMINPFVMIAADFNRDGRVDLFIGGSGTDTAPALGEQSRLFIQTPDGRLVDETATRLPPRIAFLHDAAAADIDGDGDLDLYMGNIGPTPNGPRFCLNDGRGFFREDTTRIPSDITNLFTSFTSCALVDVNGDGRPDLVLGANTDATNEVLINDGTGRFSRDLRKVLPRKLHDATAVTVKIAAADLNGDGFPDLVMATGGGSEILNNGTPESGSVLYGYSVPGLQILLNRGDGTFSDGTQSAGVRWSSAEKSVARLQLIDLNGDGRPDLVATVANGSNGLALRVFLNVSDTPSVRFVDISATANTQNGAFYLASDLNGDGVGDLVSGTGSSITHSRGLKPITVGRLTNLSVRTQAGTGEQMLIAGFALGGGAGTKPVLVRAVGPTLASFGVVGSLADPFLEVAPLGGANVATNKGWSGTVALKNTFTSVGAFPLSPDNSKDAALVFPATPSAYTARVTSDSNRTGVALVELYDAGTGNTPRLTNVSARSVVGNGGDVLVTGFVTNGTLPKKLLIRASGPSLAALGVGGTLDDPVLTVRPLGRDTIAAVNDDWGGNGALKAAFSSVGAFAFVSDTSKDAAIVVELPAGAYTATVSGKNNATGVALVEVYEVSGNFQ